MRYGHINKHSNGFLRWAFIQSARAAVRSSKPNRFQRIYNKIKARRGEKVAIVATARHMAKSVYWILTKKEYYKENKALRASSFSCYHLFQISTMGLFKFFAPKPALPTMHLTYHCFYNFLYFRL